jgi:hypothetical protein
MEGSLLRTEVNMARRPHGLSYGGRFHDLATPAIVTPTTPSRRVVRLRLQPRREEQTRGTAVSLPTSSPPIADVLTMSCPPSGDECVGIGNREDHFIRPTTGPFKQGPLSSPLVISDFRAANQS